MLRHVTRSLLCGVVLFTAVVNLNCGPRAAAGPRTVLSRIENYQAGPYPASQYVKMETYDYRRRSGATNPPSLVDALIADVWLLLTKRLGVPQVSPGSVSVAHITQVGTFVTDRCTSDNIRRICADEGLLLVETSPEA